MTPFGEVELLDEEIVREIDKELSRLGITAHVGKEFIQEIYGVDCRRFLTKEQAHDFLEFLRD
jgi:hypothetical protein